MKRSDFIKGLGLISMGSVLPLNKAKAATSVLSKVTNSYILIPEETEEPYPFES